MPSLSDLWDENKYSEGDPIRQLISATKAVKEWPMDVLAWGADLVDLGSSGLSKALHNQDLKTDLGGNLRRSVTPPLYEGKPSFSAVRAEDLEDARSIGRMLNPLFLGGNQKLPGSGIVNKIVNQLTGASEIDKGKRAFLVGKPAEDQVSVLTDILTTPVTRREFMKNSALVSGGVAAATIPGAKLLQKFIPEEKAAAKVIEKLATTETAPRYEYNSLKDYLDDMIKFAEEDQRAAELRFGPQFTKEQRLRERLLKDEREYNYLKEISNGVKNPKDIAYRIHFDNAPEFFEPDEIIQKNGYFQPRLYDELPIETKKAIDKSAKLVESKLNAFSPKAKEEMKEYKDYVRSGYYDYNKVNNPTMTDKELSSFTKDTWVDHIIDDFLR